MLLSSPRSRIGLLILFFSLSACSSGGTGSTVPGTGGSTGKGGGTAQGTGGTAGSVSNGGASANDAAAGSPIVSGGTASGGAGTTSGGAAAGAVGTSGGAGAGGLGAAGAGAGGSAVGGSNTGGVATGGVATGGIATGGAASGGTATGGAGSGGSATGGAGSGGRAGTGGTGSGGSAAGGTASGGRAGTGGAGSGGSAAGGTASGGSAAGGAGSGGIAAGGSGAGGAGAGGAGTGGAGDPITCGTPGSKSLPAFPGAEGFGAFAKGGRGGDVYHVTNLAASGAGSFAYGIENVPATGRTIVFDVSGYASISGVLTASKGPFTVAGQTAPGDGFALKDGTFWLSVGDVIIRHMRFRDGYSADSVDMDSKAVNFIWDHCDMMFSHDENMSSFGTPPENMTYQYSINAWGLETHSCGGLWDQSKATGHHSLWAHNHTRNPKARATLLDWVNNVTFDWDIGFIMGDSGNPANWRANVRGSYFVSGTAKTNALESANLDTSGKPNFHLFMEDCALDGNINGVLDVTKTDFDMASGDYEKVTTPFPLTADFQPVSASNPIVGVPVTQDDHLTAYKKVISSVGPLRLDVKYQKPLRDEVDALVVNDLVTQNHRHLNYQQIDANGLSNGGMGTLSSTPAPADTDKDGMPDYWEKAVGLNPSLDDHNGLVPCVYAYVPGNVGYTWLEDYLQWLAIPHGVVAKGTSLDVDMTRFTSGLKAGAVYTVSSAVNGTVSVAADGKTAHFVPNPNFVGRAGFKFSGTDSDKSTIASDVGVLVGETAATN